ncbi:MAG: DUF4874 domain-containing protein [Oscillospiraceae bacterium]|nr:DUF4874 domain-containing protein [Oscillospiraceae bacterium]
MDLPLIPAKVEPCETMLDQSLPFLYADNSAVLLKNPDRGLRMETYITLGDPVQTYPGTGADPYEKLRSLIEKYKEESPAVVQGYVYLTRYRNKELDATALSQMKQFFELCRQNNVRILLRFAYSTESFEDAPYRWVSKNLKQIGAWFQENEQLVEDTVYAVQGGLIGYWGEGHGYKNFKQKHIGKAFAELCDIVPEHLYVQLRTLTLAETVPEKYQKRLGMHHDYIIGDLSHPWGYVFPDGKEEEALAHFQTTVNDGELPWGRAYMNDNPALEPLNNLPPEKLLPEIARYGLSTLSLEHNYREGDGPNTPYTLERWKSIFYSPEELHAMGLPVNPNLYQNSDNTPANVSAFTYLQQHLGYHLVLSNIRRENKEVSFTITNYGLAAPNNFNALSVFIGEDEYAVGDYDKTALQPGKSIAVTVTLPQEISPEQPVGVKLTVLPHSGCSVRFANDTPFQNGIQYILNYK